MSATIDPARTPTQLRSITVKEYYRMAEVGILQSAEKLELIMEKSLEN